MSMLWVAGVDEAGRGPLAGPVVAAAVILDPARPVAGLADSKCLSARRREFLWERIRDCARAFAIAEVAAAEIDRLNILKATLQAMTRAIEALPLKPARVQVDGNQPPQLDGIEVETLVGGDRLIAAISAASILAKVYRDRRMREIHRRFPDYGFARHKGYPTRAHLAALARHGPCPEHRKSYRPVRDLNPA